MKEVISFLFFVILTASVFAQTNGPGSRFGQLQSSPLTKDSIFKRIKTDLEFINPTPEDTIADIGSYDGFYPCLYSVFSDSICFYLNDLTNEAFIHFDKLKNLSSLKKGDSLTNTFKIILGTDSCTNLPTKRFNKVILRDALHHFNSMDKMLYDIKRIMKPNAQIILFETIKYKEKSQPNLCHGSMTKEELLLLMNNHKLKLIRELELPSGNYWFEFVAIQ